jgi:hypothetical protein
MGGLFLRRLLKITNMSNCTGLPMTDLRNFREETSLTGSEEIVLKWVAGKLGMTKSGTLRFGILQLANHLKREEMSDETGFSTED